MSAEPKPDRAKATDRIYSTRSVKRKRRTKQEMAELLAATQRVLKEGQMTIRHLFYRLAGLSFVPKTEQGYHTLDGHLMNWRRSGIIPWNSFTDHTRWYIRHDTFDSMDEALANTVATYRRNLWQDQPCYIEIWVEKDSMAGVVADTATSFGVPVFVARGFNSGTSLFEAAMTFKEAYKNGKQGIIYHLGDYDPSGFTAYEAMARAFERDFHVPLKFVHVAVTLDQIKKFKLPTRPTKKSSHDRNWTGGDSVELDTMPPDEIRKLVKHCITQHIDQHAWKTLKATEEAERDLKWRHTN